MGTYVVTFSGLGARLSTGVGGHVQTNAVGTGKAHCKTYEWGSGTDVGVEVRCYTPVGAPADSKFTVLFTPPAAHLAYAWADQPSTAYYSPYPVFSSNPVGGGVTITNHGAGIYTIRWTGVDAEIRDLGNAQVTAYGESAAQCKVTGSTQESVGVMCFAPNSARVNTYFTVLLGS